MEKYRRTLISGLLVSGMLSVGCIAARSTPATQAASGLASTAKSPVGDSYTQAYTAENQRILANEKVTVNTSKFKKKGPYVVGYVAQGPINGWGKEFDVAMRYELQKSGQLKKLLYINSGGSASKEVTGMEDLIAQHPDIIILTPLGKAALSAPVNRAVAAGIPVVVTGGSVQTDRFTAEVGRNLPQTAYQSALHLAKMLHGKGNVVMFDGIAGSDSAEGWKAAAHAAFEKFPGIKIVAEQYANWSVATATTQMQAILAAHPRVDGVWSGGSEMSVGAVNAFAGAHKTMPMFGTTNPLNGFLRLAKQYHLKFYGAPYPPAAMSKVSADVALKILGGKSVKKYTDVIKIVPQTGGYTQAKIGSRYRPDMNDDFVPPAAIPIPALKKGGFAR